MMAKQVTNPNQLSQLVLKGYKSIAECDLPLGSINVLIGANGAGKSELVLAVAGIMPPFAGRISVDGIDLSGKTPDFIRAAGVAAVPEGHQVLTGLSVEDNLRAAGSLLGRPALHAELARVYQVFPELAERKGQMAGTMSGGQQQMLAIGHALMARPRYLLTEPGVGYRLAIE